MELNHSRIRKLIIIGICFIFAGCSMSSQTKTDGNFIQSNEAKSSKLYSYTTENYYILLPKDFKDNKIIDRKEYFGYSDKSSIGGAMITFLNHSSPCSPQVLGAWDYTVKEMTVGNDKALWGRADYYDGSDNPGWEPNFDTVCEGDIGGALYSFCSEKNRKTVVICFLQGTKDEALAESIFQTFRWTK